MLTLGIESAGPAGSVALARGEELIAERTLDRSGPRHAANLVVEIDALVRGAGRKIRDCELVAVSIGPGSFTGLRVGVVCAKTLSYALGCSLVAVDTLESIAENSPAEVSDVFVLSDAHRGELYAGQYR